MAVRFIRIGQDHPPRGVFRADVEINGRLQHFQTRADDVVEALEVFCARLRRDFGSELDTYEPREVSTATIMKCPQCQDCGWVCEEHPGRPWDGDHACTCGSAGMPCPRCNQPEDGEEPRLPEGFRTGFDKDGWRH